MLLGNLSENAEKVLAVAAAESEWMNHFYIGTEHLFIGLCKVEDGVIKEIFQEFNIDPRLRRELRARVGQGNDPVWGKELILTPRVKNISRSVEEMARIYQARQLEPMHLLLALLRGGDGVAVRMLKEKGIDPEQMRSAIEARLEQAAEELRLNPSAARTPFLNKIGRDLTLLALQGKIDPVIGRKEEIKKIAQILSMRKKNNPVLVGEVGVGKTAVVEGLALRLIREDVPEELKGLRIIEVSLTALVAGTKYRGDFEERILKMVEEASKNEDVVLFIDEIHNLIGAGSASGSLDASNILKPALARGDIRCIGATTIEEYRKHIEKDPALERRFQPVYIDEPTKEEAIEIVQGLKRTYEAHYKIKIREEAIKAAVEFSIRYIHDRNLPDKALDLIDQASAKKRLKTLTVHRPGQETGGLELTEEDIAEVVAEWTGIPVTKLTEEEAERLLKMEETLRQRVIGQDEAIKAVAHTIRTAKAGLGNPNRPIGVFLFLGPTGVGKTELAKALAKFLFDDDKKMIRFDMSEYLEKHTVSKLIGAPPGYVGYEEEGQLTGAVRTHPYSVILFDEIEKAHPDIYNLFLQVFDEGRLTDARGKMVVFTNTVIIMTSNIGAESEIKKKMGFVQSEEKVESGREKEIEEVRSALSRQFRPEFLNRIDKVVVFNPLGKEAIRLIIDKLLAGIRGRLLQKGVLLHVPDEVYDFLMKHGYSEQYGAREMDRVIHRMVIEPFAEELLEEKFAAGDAIYLHLESGRIVFRGQDELQTQ